MNDYLLFSDLIFLMLSTKNVSTQDSTQPDSFSTGDTVRKSQHQLTKACINYLKLEKMVQIQNTAESYMLQ